MVIQKTDIQFVLSGGSLNNDPDLSLGGPPSAQSITSATLNNLFDSVTIEESASGHVDYRCFYVFNNHSTDTFYNVRAYITQTIDGSATEIGVLKRTEVQTIRIQKTASGGTFQIQFTGAKGNTETKTILYQADLEDWGIEIQTKLNSHSDVSGLVVAATEQTSHWLFTCSFLSDDDNRFQETMTVANNSLTGSPTIDIAVVQNGSPLNSIANFADTDNPDIGFETTEPFEVVFDEYTQGNPLSIGDLYAGDGVPIWVKRTTEPGSSAQSPDSMTIHIVGNPLED